jgi:hypothetical protein
MENLIHSDERMTDNNFLWILNWYFKQCHGEWKDSKSIEIRTIDNPGWSLKICLNETELQDKEFQKIKIDRSEHDWIRCSNDGNIFECFGGPLNLPEILEIFRKWAE